MKNFKIIGTWWNDKTIPLARINGEVYALSGWNGESYGHCWKCLGEFFMDASAEEYEIEEVCLVNPDNGEVEVAGYNVKGA